MPTDPISDADLSQLTSAWLLAVDRATEAAESAQERERSAANFRNAASKARGEERDAFEALLTYRMRARLEPTKSVEKYATTDLRDRAAAAVGRPTQTNP